MLSLETSGTPGLMATAAMRRCIAMRIAITAMPAWWA